MAPELKLKGGGRRLAPIPSNVHSLLRWIWEEITRQRVSAASVARRAGYNPKTLRSWWRGDTAPTLHDVEAVVNALGYDMVIMTFPAIPEEPT